MKTLTIILLLIISPILSFAGTCKDNIIFDDLNPSYFYFVGDSYNAPNSFVINNSIPFALGAFWYKDLVSLRKGFEINFSFKIS